MCHQKIIYKEEQVAKVCDTNDDSIKYLLIFYFFCKSHIQDIITYKI